MAKSNEPILWLLFSAGGMISAMIFPILMVITGIILPFILSGDAIEILSQIHLNLKNTFVKIVIFFAISLPFFHWAHRFRFTLVDIGLKQISFLISMLCYGGAVTGSVVTVIILWGI